MKVKSFECPKSIRNYEKKYLEHQTLGPISPAGLYSPNFPKCYFLQIHAKICSKVPMFYFSKPKRPP